MSGADGQLDATVPVDEAARLQALAALDLSAAGDERFDRIARLARRLLDAPVALVTVVGDEEQWAVGCVGLADRTLPRAQAICAHTLATGRPLVVPDLTADPRFSSHPLVTGAPHLRFYAGHPIAAAEGGILGTVCVMDHAPRTLDAEGLGALADLAHLAELELASEQLSVALQGRHHAEERLRRIVDSTPDGVVTVDARGTVTYANPAAGRLLGAARDDILGRRVTDLDAGAAAGELPDDLLWRWRTARAGVLRRHGDGELVDVDATVAPLEDGSGGWVVTLREAGERRALERLRHNLLSSVSHELRTPLTGVLGFLDALATGDGGPLTDDQAELAQLAVKSANDLDAVVMRLLRVVELEAPQPGPSARALRLDELVREVADRFPDAPLEITGPAGGEHVLGDRGRLMLALSELVANALLHGPPGGPVQLRADARDDGHVLVEVRDSGDGIGAEEAPYIAERFYRGRAAGTRPGLGLGLAMAREIVEQHGGALEVDGPAVRLVLPRRRVG